jgi:ubiquitin-protein ligase E3 C
VACLRSFFTSLRKAVFDTDRGLWLANKRNEIYHNPHSYTSERTSSAVCSLVLTLTFISDAAHNSNWYRFIGRILGKALYKGILVEGRIRRVIPGQGNCHC